MIKNTIIGGDYIHNKVNSVLSAEHSNTRKYLNENIGVTFTDNSSLPLVDTDNNFFNLKNKKTFVR